MERHEVNQIVNITLNLEDTLELSMFQSALGTSLAIGYFGESIETVVISCDSAIDWLEQLEEQDDYTGGDKALLKLCKEVSEKGIQFIDFIADPKLPTEQAILPKQAVPL